MADVTTEQLPEVVNLVNPQGKLVGVPAAEVSTALQSGYRQESQDEYSSRWRKEQYGEGLGNELLAAGAGAARGLSFGLSDVLLSRTKLVNPEVLQALKEENPTASVTGEVGGVVLPALLTGGGAAVAEGGARGAVAATARGASLLPRGAAAAGRFAERAVGGRIAGLGLEGLAARALERGVAKAAGGAVEGALYGAGQLVSEAELGDQEITAERVLAHLGMSAVLGGAAGGALGAGGELATAAGRKAYQTAERIAAKRLQGSTLGEKLSDVAGELADESALKATGVRGADIRKLGTEAKIRQVGEDLRTVKLRDGRSVLESGQSGDDYLDRIRLAKREAGEDLGAFRKRVDEYVRQTPGEAWDMGEYLGRVRKEVLEPLQESGVPSVRNKAKKIWAELAPAQKAYEKGYKFAPKEFEKLRRDLADVVYPKRPPGGGLPPQPPPHAAELMQAERILADFIEQKTEGVVAKLEPEAAGTYAHLKRVSESMIKAEKLADKAAKQDLGNRWLSPTDYLTGMGGGVIAGGPLGAVAGLGVAALHKLVRERGRSVVASVAGKVAKLNALKSASDGVESKITQAIDGFLNKAQGAEPSRALVPASVQALEQPIAAATPSQRAAERKPKKQEKPAIHRQRINELRELAMRPEVMTERIGRAISGISDEAPGVATRVATKASAAAQFLASKAPRDTTPPTLLNPLARKWQPSANDMAKWSRYVAAVEDPTTVLDDLNDGTVSHEAVEAMKVVYPKLYESIRTQLMERVVQLQEELPYRQRVQLSILFGAPLDPTLQPAVVARIQSIHQSSAKLAAAAQARPASGGKSATALALAPPSERLLQG